MTGVTCDLRLGAYQDVLADVECDAVIADPPYSERTHAGHNALNREDGGIHNKVAYAHWAPEDVVDFVKFWDSRSKGWIAALTDDVLIPVWRAAYATVGRVDFAPVPCIIPGMSCRFAGDGPSSWSTYLMVGRPRNSRMKAWGTLPGAYESQRSPQWQNGGGGGRSKSLDLMRAIVSDYSRPGELVADPCAGYGSTLAAALMKGRMAVGAEVDAEVHAEALRRLAGVQYVDLFDPGRASQGGLDL